MKLPLMALFTSLMLAGCDPVLWRDVEVSLVEASPPLSSEVTPGTPVHLRFEISSPPGGLLRGHFLGEDGPEATADRSLADWTVEVAVGGTPLLLNPGVLAVPFTSGPGPAVLDLTLTPQVAGVNLQMFRLWGDLAEPRATSRDLWLRYTVVPHEVSP